MLNLFLQAFDEGWITDGRGKRVYLSDAIVIMTSNIGSEYFRKLTSPLGFLSQQVGRRADSGRGPARVERRFTPEFRNRIDEVVHLPAAVEGRSAGDRACSSSTRSRRSLREGRQYADASRPTRSIGWSQEGYSLAYGARFLKRTIDERIKLPISQRWNEGAHFARRRSSEATFEIHGRRPALQLAASALRISAG